MKAKTSLASAVLADRCKSSSSSSTLLPPDLLSLLCSDARQIATDPPLNVRISIKDNVRILREKRSNQSRSAMARRWKQRLHCSLVQLSSKARFRLPPAKSPLPASKSIIGTILYRQVRHRLDLVPHSQRGTRRDSKSHSMPFPDPRPDPPKTIPTTDLKLLRGRLQKPRSPKLQWNQPGL